MHNRHPGSQLICPVWSARTIHDARCESTRSGVEKSGFQGLRSGILPDRPLGEPVGWGYRRWSIRAAGPTAQNASTPAIAATFAHNERNARASPRHTGGPSNPATRARGRQARANSTTRADSSWGSGSDSDGDGTPVCMGASQTGRVPEKRKGVIDPFAARPPAKSRHYTRFVATPCKQAFPGYDTLQTACFVGFLTVVCATVGTQRSEVQIFSPRVSQIPPNA